MTVNRDHNQWNMILIHNLYSFEHILLFLSQSEGSFTTSESSLQLQGVVNFYLASQINELLARLKSSEAKPSHSSSNMLVEFNCQIHCAR